MGSKWHSGVEISKNIKAHTSKRKIKGGTPGEGSPLDPLLRFYEHKGVPPAAAGGQGRRPWTLPPLKRWTKLSNARVARGYKRADPMGRAAAHVRSNAANIAGTVKSLANATAHTQPLSAKQERKQGCYRRDDQHGLAGKKYVPLPDLLRVVCPVQGVGFQAP